MEHSKLTAILSQKGYCHLAAQSAGQVHALIDALGRVFFTTDVKVVPNSKALVTSARALDVHTDHHRAHWILWHCLEQTDIGGESVLVDAIQAYRTLAPADQKMLSQVILLEHKIFDKGMDFCPLLWKDNGALKFYYSFWLAKKDMPQDQKTAFDAFRKAVGAQERTIIKLGQGDVLIVANHRILHGRRAIEGHQKRLLKRYWIE